MRQKSEEISGTIESLAFGGEGILRDADGFVWFIPYTVPGEDVICKPETKKARHGYAKAVNIVKESPLRVAPVCPHYFSCGGCQLQHLDYREQLIQKRQIVVDALERIGGICNPNVLPMVACSREYGYRRHITLHFEKKDGALALGYISNERELMKINRCPLFDASPELFLQLSQLLNALKLGKDQRGRVSLFKYTDTDYYLFIKIKDFSQSDNKLLEKVINEKTTPFVGITVDTGNKIINIGLSEYFFICDGLKITYSPGAFIQNNADQSQQMYRALASLVKQVQPKSFLDLYCGIGISSLLVARSGVATIAVEISKDAIACAKMNAQAAKMSNVNFIAGDVAKHLPQLLKSKPEMIFTNPPRGGLDPEVLNNLKSSGAAHLIYMSCMPATLARDIKQLSAKYKVISVQTYDMFPQTTHVECLAHLQLID